jgi:hypothetical protein
MQTFLPYSDYSKSAQVLDRQRLGKQRVETIQILKALNDPTYGWQNHPAVNMWRGYELELVCYGLAICDEWITRGYKDTCRDQISEMYYNSNFDVEIPPWIGSLQFHKSHQSNLIRKAPEYYRPIFGDNVPDDLEYVWP